MNKIIACWSDSRIGEKQLILMCTIESVRGIVPFRSRARRRRRRLMNFKANKPNDDFFRRSYFVVYYCYYRESRASAQSNTLWFLSRNMIALINIYVIWARAKQAISGGCDVFEFLMFWATSLSFFDSAQKEWVSDACARHDTKQQSHSSCQWQFHHRRLEYHSDFSLANPALV